MSSLCTMYPRKKAFFVSDVASDADVRQHLLLHDVARAYRTRSARPTFIARPRRPRKSSATVWFCTTNASSSDGRNFSIMSLSVKSYTMCSRMSRSATKPSARKTTTTGTSVWMYGSVARMWPPST